MADTAEGEIGLVAGLALAALGVVVVRVFGGGSSSQRAAPPLERGRASVPTPPRITRPIVGQPGQPQPSSVMTTDPNLAPWQPIVDRLIAAEYPQISAPFAMKWIEIESDGNPCAVGEPGQLGQGSDQPAEIGLGQLYNPDDFRAFGISPATFRAYAPAAAPLAAQYTAALAAGNKAAAAAVARTMQSRTRALTQAEQDDQVRWTVLAKIAQGINLASGAVMTYGLKWSQSDVWKLVKAPHAYPKIIGQGLPAVVKKLGRAPSSWSEFRTALGMDLPNAQQLCKDGDKTACVHWTWMRALNACETCGNATQPAVA